MRLKECHGLSEVHVVATPKRVAKGLYQFNMKMPKYARHSFGRQKTHIKFKFYRTKDSSTPFMTARYGNSTYVDDNQDTISFVVQKIHNNMCNSVISVPDKWQPYGVPAKFALQDYSKHGYNDGDGMYKLHAKRIEQLLDIIRRIRLTKHTYWYCAEEVDELDVLYKENIEKFIYAARLKGIKNIYIGNRKMFCPDIIPNHSGSFSCWLSSFSDLLGSKYCRNPDGLQGGSGNSSGLHYYNLNHIFPPDMYRQYYRISYSSDKLIPTHMKKELIKKAKIHDFRDCENLNNLSAIIRSKENTIPQKDCVDLDRINRVSKIPNVPEKAIDIYKEFIEVYTLYLKRACRYLFLHDYTIINTQFRNNFTGMMLVNKSYSHSCRIRIDEASDSVPGPWITDLTSFPLVDIVTDEEGLTEYLTQIPYKETTFIEYMRKLLDEVRYLVLAEKTMHRLQGNK